MFVVVEIAVLIARAARRAGAASRPPALFPLRLLAVVYIDVFRGVPTILVIYLIGFGVPALELSGRSRPTRSCSAGSRSTLCLRRVRRRGLPRRHRVGAPEPARGGALASASPRRQTMRHVVLPQAVRRVVPPLLNDFISLQKDVALVSILGPAGGVPRGADRRRGNFIYTPLVGRGAAVPLRDGPAGALLLDRWEREAPPVSLPSSRSAASRRPTASGRAARHRPGGRPSTRRSR